MANFSAYGAYKIAQILKAIDSDPLLGNNLVIALFSGTSATSLGSGLTNGEIVSDENTKYVRKPISLEVKYNSEIINHFSNPTPAIPPAVQPVPDTVQGYAVAYNDTEILWNDPPTVDWGTVTHFALIEENAEVFTYKPHGYTDTIIMWGALESPKAVLAGDIFRFPAGGVQLNLM